MWGTVLIMAVVAGVDPARIGAVAFILSRPKPMGLLGAYLFGGFGVSLIAGGLIVFVLGESGIGKSSSVPPEIEIAVGGLALVVSVLVATGIAARIRDRVQARRPRPDGASRTNLATPSCTMQAMSPLRSFVARMNDAPSGRT